MNGSRSACSTFLLSSAGCVAGRVLEQNVAEESWNGVRSQRPGWMESAFDRCSPTGTALAEPGWPLTHEVGEESRNGVRAHQAGWMASAVNRSTPTGTYIAEPWVRCTSHIVVEASLHGVRSQPAGGMESAVDRCYPTGTDTAESGGPHNSMWVIGRCMVCFQNWLAGWNLP